MQLPSERHLKNGRGPLSGQNDFLCESRKQPGMWFWLTLVSIESIAKAIVIVHFSLELDHEKFEI